MDVIIAGLIFIGLIEIANVLVLRNRPLEIRLFHWFWFILNGAGALFGLILALLPADLIATLNDVSGGSVGDWDRVGLILGLMAAWGALAAVWPVRQLLTRVMPLDVSSPVHTLALAFSGYLMGQGALTLSQGGLEGLSQTAEPASVPLFVFSELLFALVGLVGVGYLVRRDGRQSLARLGLERPRLRHLLPIPIWIIALVILQALAGVAWSMLYPDQAAVVEDVNTLLLGDVDTVLEWLALALAAGIGEEILFRGALQPVLGLGFTSLLFAGVHVQYGFTPIALVIVLLAVILGLIRRRANTTVAILVHVGYDFTLGLLALLAAYLE